MWFHWGGPPNGDAAQQLIATYNETQGRQDANRAEVEAVSFAQREGQRLLDEFWAGVGAK